MRIGPYEILSMLGKGGMGEVHRARDSRLNREVAIKLLHSDALRSPERLARFTAEARAASALNHPAIITIYDIGEADGRPYLVSEFVDGETLRAIIDRGGPMAARKLLDIAVQIADGLAAAHGAGITHRDLKPENIMLTKDGRVKILDFGLAKQSPSPDADPETDTLTNLGLTRPGEIMGTINYMSPEQARGVPVDYHSDQFSFGTILHEMASGHAPFRRSSPPETMTAIIREDAEPLDPQLPAPLRWTIERLLAKEPEERFHSTKDLYRDLRATRERLTAGSSTAVEIVPPRAPRTPRKWMWPALAAAVAGLLLGAVAVMTLIPAPRPDLASYHFYPLSREEPTETAPQWSPDGKSIAYFAPIHGTAQIFTRSVGAVSPAQITKGTFSCTFPFWSPDGSRIFFRANSGIWAVPASGGDPQLILKDAQLAAIHPDGKTFAFARNGKLTIGAADGTAREYTNAAYPKEASVNALQFSPDGKKLAVVSSLPATLGRWGLWIIPFPDGAPRKLERLFTRTGFRSFSWYPDNRRIVYPQVDAADNTAIISLDTDSNEQRTLFTSPMALFSPSVSPDGTRVAISGGMLEWNLIEISLTDRSVHPLLTRGGVTYFPDWDPTGSHYLLATNTQGTSEIDDRSTKDGFVRRLITLSTDGLDAHLEWFSQPRWSPDGDRFAFSSSGPTGQRLWVASSAGSRPVVLDPSADENQSPAWSPDGEWIAYLRQKGDQLQLAKSRPGSVASMTILTAAKPVDRNYVLLQWTARGDAIAYLSAEGISIVSADNKNDRLLTKRRFSVYGFSSDGRSLYGILRSTAMDSPEWQLYSVDVDSGTERVLGPLDFPTTANNLAGFSMHPGTDRFATSIVKTPYDIWMLEGSDDRKPH